MPPTNASSPPQASSFQSSASRPRQAAAAPRAREPDSLHPAARTPLSQRASCIRRSRAASARRKTLSAGRSRLARPSAAAPRRSPARPACVFSRTGAPLRRNAPRGRCTPAHPPTCAAYASRYCCRASRIEYAFSSAPRLSVVFTRPVPTRPSRRFFRASTRYTCHIPVSRRSDRRASPRR